VVTRFDLFSIRVGPILDLLLGYLLRLLEVLIHLNKPFLLRVEVFQVLDPIALDFVVPALLVVGFADLVFVGVVVGDLRRKFVKRLLDLVELRSDIILAFFDYFHLLAQTLNFRILIVDNFLGSFPLMKRVVF